MQKISTNSSGHLLNHFLTKRGSFFKKIEEERRENLKLKQELVEKAETLKDSEDFRKTSDELKRMQKKWKEIGPVPEKYRNEVFLNLRRLVIIFLIEGEPIVVKLKRIMKKT